jgi:NTE family protein
MLTMTERQLNLSMGKSGNITRGFTSRSRLMCVCLVLLLTSGCASYGVIHNEPGTDIAAGQPYSLKTWAQSEEAADFIFILTFSGGGTRAAAMAYGVLQELRDTAVTIDGKQGRLLDEVTHISSVSGGGGLSARRSTTTRYCFMMRPSPT